MKIFSLFVFCASIVLSGITDYQVTHLCYSGHTAIRAFIHNGKRKQLLVNNTTLQTSLQDTVTTAGHACRDNDRYHQLLRQSAQPPYPLQNDGMTRTRKRIAVTTDLCPSSKQGFEQRLYVALMQHFAHPVPVTLFVTGNWIEKHPQAFRQLTAWEKARKLSITWGNHTYTHPYHPGEPLKKNFSLSQGYDLKSDTLKLEKLLIESGITPSVLFRFPGLVSDKETIQTIHQLGLITVGSNTWVAKGQRPKEGSILLLHGNKNEPKGVEMFLQMLEKREIPEVYSLPESL